MSASERMAEIREALALPALDPEARALLRDQLRELAPLATHEAACATPTPAHSPEPRSPLRAAEVDNERGWRRVRSVDAAELLGARAGPASLHEPTFSRVPGVSR